MNHAGIQYGQGSMASGLGQYGAGAEVSAMAGTGNTTASLRQWRKKEASEKQQTPGEVSVSTTESQGPIARVAPHAHYPQFNRLPTHQYQANDYGSYQDLSPAPVKYSEIVEPPVAPSRIDTQLGPVIAKTKEKEYLEMCNVQQSQINGMKHQAGYPSSLPPVIPQYKDHYVQKESQMHAYPPTNPYHPIPHNYKLPPNQYQRPFPVESSFHLTFYNERNVAPEPSQLYQMDQRAYQNQRMYRTNYRPPYHPPTMQNYAYRQQLQNQDPYRMHHYQQPIPKYTDYKFQMESERNLTMRRMYPESLVNYPRSSPPNFNQCAQMEYAQHYQNQNQNRRQIPPEYFQRTEPKISYIPNQQMPDLVTDASPKSSLKSYLENWNDDIPDIQETTKEIRLKDVEENLYILDVTEIPKEKILPFIHLQVGKLPENVKGYIGPTTNGVIKASTIQSPDSVIKTQTPKISVISETKKFLEIETKLDQLLSNEQNTVIVFNDTNDKTETIDTVIRENKKEETKSEEVPKLKIPEVVTIPPTIKERDMPKIIDEINPELEDSKELTATKGTCKLPVDELPQNDEYKVKLPDLDDLKEDCDLITKIIPSSNEITTIISDIKNDEIVSSPKKDDKILSKIEELVLNEDKVSYDKISEDPKKNVIDENCINNKDEITDKIEPQEDDFIDDNKALNLIMEKEVKEDIKEEESIKLICDSKSSSRVNEEDPKESSIKTDDIKDHEEDFKPPSVILKVSNNITSSSQEFTNDTKSNIKEETENLIKPRRRNSSVLTKAEMKEMPEMVQNIFFEPQEIEETLDLSVNKTSDFVEKENLTEVTSSTLEDTTLAVIKKVRFNDVVEYVDDVCLKNNSNCKDDVMDDDKNIENSKERDYCNEFEENEVTKSPENLTNDYSNEEEIQDEVNELQSVGVISRNDDYKCVDNQNNESQENINNQDDLNSKDILDENVVNNEIVGVISRNVTDGSKSVDDINNDCKENIKNQVELNHEDIMDENEVVGVISRNITDDSKFIDNINNECKENIKNEVELNHENIMDENEVSNEIVGVISRNITDKSKSVDNVNNDCKENTKNQEDLDHEDIVHEKEVTNEVVGVISRNITDDSKFVDINNDCNENIENRVELNPEEMDENDVNTELVEEFPKEEIELENQKTSSELNNFHEDEVNNESNEVINKNIYEPCDNHIGVIKNTSENYVVEENVNSQVEKGVISVQNDENEIPVVVTNHEEHTECSIRQKVIVENEVIVEKLITTNDDNSTVDKSIEEKFNEPEKKMEEEELDPIETNVTCEYESTIVISPSESKGIDDDLNCEMSSSQEKFYEPTNLQDSNIFKEKEKSDETEEQLIVEGNVVEEQQMQCFQENEITVEIESENNNIQENTRDSVETNDYESDEYVQEIKIPEEINLEDQNIQANKSNIEIIEVDQGDIVEENEIVVDSGIQNVQENNVEINVLENNDRQGDINHQEPEEIMSIICENEILKNTTKLNTDVVIDNPVDDINFDNKPCEETDSTNDLNEENHFVNLTCERIENNGENEEFIGAVDECEEENLRKVIAAENVDDDLPPILERITTPPVLSGQETPPQICEVPENIQVTNAVIVEDNSVLLQIGGEVIEINVISSLGKKIVSVVPYTDCTVVSENNNLQLPEEENNTEVFPINENENIISDDDVSFYDTIPMNPNDVIKEDDSPIIFEDDCNEVLVDGSEQETEDPIVPIEENDTSNILDDIKLKTSTRWIVRLNSEDKVKITNHLRKQKLNEVKTNQGLKIKQLDIKAKFKKLANNISKDFIKKIKNIENLQIAPKKFKTKGELKEAFSKKNFIKNGKISRKLNSPQTPPNISEEKILAETRRTRKKSSDHSENEKDDNKVVSKIEPEDLSNKINENCENINGLKCTKALRNIRKKRIPKKLLDGITQNEINKPKNISEKSKTFEKKPKKKSRFRNIEGPEEISTDFDKPINQILTSNNCNKKDEVILKVAEEILVNGKQAKNYNSYDEKCSNGQDSSDEKLKSSVEASDGILKSPNLDNKSLQVSSKDEILENGEKKVKINGFSINGSPEKIKLENNAKSKAPRESKKISKIVSVLKESLEKKIQSEIANKNSTTNTSNEVLSTPVEVKNTSDKKNNTSLKIKKIEEIPDILQKSKEEEEVNCIEEAMTDNKNNEFKENSIKTSCLSGNNKCSKESSSINNFEPKTGVIKRVGILKKSYSETHIDKNQNKLQNSKQNDDKRKVPNLLKKRLSLEEYKRKRSYPKDVIKSHPENIKLVRTVENSWSHRITPAPQPHDTKIEVRVRGVDPRTLPRSELINNKAPNYFGPLSSRYEKIIEEPEITPALRQYLANKPSKIIRAEDKFDNINKFDSTKKPLVDLIEEPLVCNSIPIKDLFQKEVDESSQVKEGGNKSVQNEERIVDNEVVDTNKEVVDLDVEIDENKVINLKSVDEKTSELKMTKVIEDPKSDFNDSKNNLDDLTKKIDEIFTQSLGTRRHAEEELWRRYSNGERITPEEVPKVMNVIERKNYKRLRLDFREKRRDLIDLDELGGNKVNRNIIDLNDFNLDPPRQAKMKSIIDLNELLPNLGEVVGNESAKKESSSNHDQREKCDDKIEPRIVPNENRSALECLEATNHQEEQIEKLWLPDVPEPTLPNPETYSDPLEVSGFAEECNDETKTYTSVINTGEDLKLHIKKIESKKARKKRRFRNLHSCDSEPDEPPDYSVFESENQHGLPKLIIKRNVSESRDQHLQPVVRIQRDHKLDNLAKRKRKA